MTDAAAILRVILTEARLELACRRLRAAQAAVVLATGAPGALEAATVAQQVAQAEAAAARAALAPRSGDRGPDVAQARPSGEPSPRLRFARWLAETGRLSDWPDPA